MISAIKDAFVGSRQSLFQAMNVDTSQDDIKEEIPIDFISRERQNSIIENLRHSSWAAPRGSVSQPSGRYESVSNSLRTEQQAINGDVLQSVEDDSIIIKEVSPSVYVPRNPILPMDPLEMELDKDELLPCVVEDEYVPLYCDEEGNLVRPPFINLDPRERYQMLKLKKSVEATERLRNTMKYMIDPDETISITKTQNKVDCSTQTHNQEYLDKTLHFTTLQKKLALRNRRQRNTTKAKGFFSGSFLYDPVESKAPMDRGSKLKGYLGDIHKPKFPTESKVQQRKLLADEEKTPQMKLKSRVNERVGLENALRTGNASAYLPQAQANGAPASISSIIQVKRALLPSKKSIAGPSSGFEFDLNQSAIAPLLGKKESTMPHLTLPSTQETAGSASSNEFSFLKPSSDEQLARSTFFSLTTPDEDDDARVKKRSRPGISSSSPSKPLFGITEELLTEKKTFSFPANGFSSSASESLPLFGSKPAEEQKFALNAPAKRSESSNSAPKPAFKLTSATPEGTPLFSFGSVATEKPKDEKPSFSFLKHASEKQASFPFAKLSKSASNSSETEISEVKDKKGKNDQGKEREKKDVENQKAGSLFNFGEQPALPSISKDVNPSVPKAPTFSFGASSSAFKPLFGASQNDVVPLFGAKTDHKSTHDKPTEDNSTEAKVDGSSLTSKPNLFSLSEKQVLYNPTVSFGAPVSSENETPTPVMSLGQASSGKAAEESSKQMEKKENPQFLFGGVKTDSSQASKPSSLFGVSAEKPATTSFSFGPSAAVDALKKTDSSVPFGAAPSTLAPVLNTSSSFYNAPTTTTFQRTNTAPPFGQGKKLSPQAEAPKPVFSFGSAAIVDPAAIFGGGSSAPAPSFDFSVPNLNSAQGTTPVPNFSQPSAQKPGGFSFSSKAIGGISGGKAPSPGFSFGAPTHANTVVGNTNFGGFSASSGTTGGFGNGTRSTTPNTNGASNPGFSFGGSNGMRIQQNSFQSGFGNAPQPAGFSNTPQPSGFGNNTSQSSAFGNTPQPPAFGGTQSGFSFSGNVVNKAVGDSPFGAGSNNFGPRSREATPSFGAGAAPGHMGQEQPFVPPIANISGRKIAQMRQRKRF